MGARQSNVAAASASDHGARASTVRSSRAVSHRHTGSMKSARSTENPDTLSERERICSCFRGCTSGRISNSHLCPKHQENLGSGTSSKTSSSARMYPNASQIDIDVSTRTTTTSTMKSASGGSLTESIHTPQAGGGSPSRLPADRGRDTQVSSRDKFQVAHDRTVSTTESHRSRRSDGERQQHRSGEHRPVELRQQRSGESRGSDRQHRSGEQRRPVENSANSRAFAPPSRNRVEKTPQSHRLQRAQTQEHFRSSQHRRSSGGAPAPITYQRAHTEQNFQDPRDIGRRKSTNTKYRRGNAF